MQQIHRARERSKRKNNNCNNTYTHKHTHRSSRYKCNKRACALGWLERVQCACLPYAHAFALTLPSALSLSRSLLGEWVRERLCVRALASSICWKHKQYLMALLFDCGVAVTVAAAAAAASCVSTHAWRMSSSSSSRVKEWLSEASAREHEEHSHIHTH